MKLLIATHNVGKLREYALIFRDLPLELLSLSDVGIEDDVAETGATFSENALLKAYAYAEMSGLLTLADDSGLVVEALDGFPGVHSARWNGPTDADRIRALLERMADVPWEARQASFVCVVALVTSRGEVVTKRGSVTGRLLFEPRGEGGFGYDPIFYVEEIDCTMAELSREEKGRRSHRGRAARKMRPVLERLLPDS